jgi:hypothetical protein
MHYFGSDKYLYSKPLSDSTVGQVGYYRQGFSRPPDPSRSSRPPRGKGASPPLPSTRPPFLILPPVVAGGRSRRAKPRWRRRRTAFPARSKVFSDNFFPVAVRIGRRQSGPAVWFPRAGGLRRGSAVVGRGSTWWRR